MRNKTFLIFGLLLIIFLAIVGGVYLKTKDLLKTDEVVIAVQNIPEQTRIQPDMVKVIEIPDKYIPPNAIRDQEEIEGKWTAAGSGIVKNSFLFEEMLVQEEEVWMTDTLKDDERIIALPVDLPSSLGGKVSRGDVVEIWFSFRGNSSTPAYAGPLLKHAEVLGLQNNRGEEILKSNENNIEDSESGLNLVVPVAESGILTVPRLMILKVPKDMVEYILMAQSMGELIVVGKVNENIEDDPVGEAKEWLEKQKLAHIENGGRQG